MCQMARNPIFEHICTINKNKSVTRTMVFIYLFYFLSKFTICFVFKGHANKAK